jgi:cell division protein FtsI/penicillin-binding protein 2
MLPFALYALPLGIAAYGGLNTLRAGGPSLALASTDKSDKGDKNAPGAGPPPHIPSSVFGDARFRGRLDLKQKKLAADGSGFEVTLDDGQRAQLTLDPSLQARAEALLADSAAPYGAVVVMSTDGRVLALATSSVAEPELPLGKLALEPWAPSASIFKLVTATALLDSGVAPETPVCYHGGLRSVEPDNLVDDGDRDGACKDFTYGLAKSQNAIVAKLAATHLDAKKLQRAAAALGYGATPDFALAALPSTVAVPDDKGERLEFARTAAGFWHSQLSPLGGALMAATIANSGLAVTPRIVSGVIPAEGGEPLPVLPVAPRRVLDPDTADAVGEMMVKTTEMGTAFKAFHDPRGQRYLGTVRVAGKTGSLSRDQPSYLNYSWFVGYAPADAPRVVVSVLLGNSAMWKLKAHTIARLVLETALAEATE